MKTQNLEAEKSVILGIMAEPEKFHLADEEVNEDDFTHSPFRRTFASVRGLVGEMSSRPHFKPFQEKTISRPGFAEPGKPLTYTEIDPIRFNAQKIRDCATIRALAVKTTEDEFKTMAERLSSSSIGD